MLGRIIDFTFEDLRYIRTISICLDEESPAFEVFEAEFRRQIEELRETGEGRVRA